MLADKAAATLRRYWVSGGYADLARMQGHWELVLAMRELAPPLPREVVEGPPPVPYEGAGCEASR